MLVKNTPIQQKVMRAIMLTSGAVLLLTFIIFSVYEYHTFRQTTVTQLSSLGEIVAANSTAALAFDDREAAYEILAALKAEANIEAAILYDLEGKMFSSFPVDAVATHTDSINFKSEKYQFTNSHLEGFQPVIQENNRLGTLYIKSNLKAMDKRMQLYAFVAAFVVLLSALLSWLLSTVLQKSISEPIISLANTAKAVSERKDYSVRAINIGKNEIGSLTEAFNHMLDQIQNQNEALSGFNRKLEQKVAERTKELNAALEVVKEGERITYQTNMELSQALEELKSTEEQLIELNYTLERKVAERTGELLASEEELRNANEELRKTNIDLDNFIYTASHDLKSPISNIEGLTLMLKRKLDHTLKDDERLAMDMINKSVAKFKSTIADLTEIAKVQKDLAYKVEKVDIKTILEDVKEDIRDLIVQSAALINEDIQIHEIIYARHNLRSIIYNLLSNAIKYRSQDKALQIDIKTYRENNFIVLSIKDNGLGIGEKQLPKLFTMFKRLHTHVEGTGIGLYIVKRIVENKGGRIEVESKLDEGTVFKVFFVTNT